MHPLADRVARLPLKDRYQREEILTDDLLLDREGQLEVYYAPFEYLSPGARVVLVGVTPGWVQMESAIRVFRHGVPAGLGHDSAATAVKTEGAFSGPLRSNLVSMLDGIGIHRALGIPSSASLFAEASALCHPTSVIRYPVFRSGANYTGHNPPLLRSSMLTRWLELSAKEELTQGSDPLVIPLGRAAELGVGHLVQQGVVPAGRVLTGFPHPSGANPHRAGQLAMEKGRLEQAVMAWRGK